MYAVIATGGKQYKVSEGDIINVEKLAAQAGETVTFDNVVAVNDGTMKAGADVADSTVTATVIKEGRAKKIIVYRYKR
ncbi:MAG TPA: 50S ribosomal protein L21, partial [Lachnospiraceae bacterium]|nr:50S ribosomal protein L21 [Lachnospiraceae bacterium]